MLPGDVIALILLYCSPCDLGEFLCCGQLAVELCGIVSRQWPRREGKHNDVLGSFGRQHGDVRVRVRSLALEDRVRRGDSVESVQIAEKAQCDLYNAVSDHKDGQLGRIFKAANEAIVSTATLYNRVVLPRQDEVLVFWSLRKLLVQPSSVARSAVCQVLFIAGLQEFLRGRLATVATKTPLYQNTVLSLLRLFQRWVGKYARPTPLAQEEIRKTATVASRVLLHCQQDGFREDDAASLVALSICHS